MFPGQYFDRETNLNYNYHRYYDPSLGRYLTSDPLGFVDGPNTYLYTVGNPVNKIDPKGLNSGAIGGAIALFCSKYPKLCIGGALSLYCTLNPSACEGLVPEDNPVFCDTEGGTQEAPSFSEEEFDDCYDLVNLCNNALKETNRDAADKGLLNECIRKSSQECAIELGID